MQAEYTHSSGMLSIVLVTLLRTSVNAAGESFVAFRAAFARSAKRVSTPAEVLGSARTRTSLYLTP